MATTLLLGGTFDPPHRVHLALAERALAHTGADRLLLIPAARSPFKLDHAQSDAHHRVAMARLAVDSLPPTLRNRINLCTLEVDRDPAADEPSYTIDTVDALRAADPDAAFRLLLGTDQLLSFHLWHDAERLARLAPPLVLVRPPDTAATVRAHLAAEAPAWLRDVELLPVPPEDVSSTAIRTDAAAGRTIIDRVPPAVAAYIKSHQLYS